MAPWVFVRVLGCHGKILGAKFLWSRCVSPLGHTWLGVVREAVVAPCGQSRPPPPPLTPLVGNPRIWD